MRPVIGAWVIGGVPAGIGIRESAGHVTGNTARFVPDRVHVRAGRSHSLGRLGGRSNTLRATDSVLLGAHHERADGPEVSCTRSSKVVLPHDGHFGIRSPLLTRT
jgi:hypothetical protein